MSALLIGAAVASVWSLPNIGFLTRFVEVAYGGPNIDQTGIVATELQFYTRYLRPFYGSQLSPLYFLAFLLAISVLAYQLFAKPSLREALGQVSDHVWVLSLWLAVPFAVFTLSLTLNSRFDLGILPAAALITAQGILSIRTRALRSTLVTILVICGLVQFLALSYDELEWLREEATPELPFVGKVNLLAEGMYIEFPGSGVTDPRYFVPPRVLEQVSTQMKLEGKETVQLGNVVNRIYSNNAIFNYLMYNAYPGIELREFARGGWEDPPVYPRLFECDYLLVASGTQDRVWQEAKDALAIIGQSPSFFEESFELFWQWTVPEGDVFYLYKKRYHLREGYDLEDYRQLGEEMMALERQGDGVVLDPPAQVEVLGRFYTGRIAVYPMPRETPLDQEESSRELEAITSKHKRILAVFWDRSESDPDHFVEEWLNTKGFRARDDWYGTVQMVIYGSGAGLGEPEEERSLAADLGHGVTLRGYRLWDKQVEPGGMLRVTLEWQAREDVQDSYKVFVHLLDEEGSLVAQRDSQPVGGSRPTSTWAESDTIADNYGVLIPEGMKSGEYRLVVGMYLPSTGVRLPVHAETAQTIDGGVLLGSIQVTSVPERGSLSDNWRGGQERQWQPEPMG